MGNLLSVILSAVNFFPGWKTRVAAVAGLALAIVSAWNSAAPAIGVDFVVSIPEWVHSAVLGLLGVGVANKNLDNAAPKP